MRSDGCRNFSPNWAQIFLYIARIRFCKWQVFTISGIWAKRVCTLNYKCCTIIKIKVFKPAVFRFWRVLQVRKATKEIKALKDHLDRQVKYLWRTSIFTGDKCAQGQHALSDRDTNCYLSRTSTTCHRRQGWAVVERIKYLILNRRLDLQRIWPLVVLFFCFFIE